ncbi:MAG: alpha/beta hydrolase [Chitinophagales bacterium]|nr:alpha/beta hydrolase [Chitinophagales bacterium]
MKSNFITANGIKLHYIDEGKGEMVVLLHGFPEFWYGWHKQIPVLAQHYRVIAPDMRGYNLSDKPANVADYKIETLAADVAALIKALGAEKAIVVGHDWGAAVAWAVAAFHPQVVKKLAILNVPHPAEMKRALMGFNLSQLKKSWYIFFFQLPFLPERIVGTEKFFRDAFARMCMKKDAVSEADIQHYVAAYKQPGAIRGPISYYRAMFRGALSTPELPKIKAPVLMLWGEHDTALGKELTYRTKDYCDNTFEIKYDPTSGHFIQHDNPQWVNEELLKFFATSTH